MSAIFAPSSEPSGATRSRRCTGWATSWRPFEMAVAFRRLPRIRTLLLATYLTVLLLPVAGIGILRLYESALLRQTEAELLAQAAVLAAAYRTAWLQNAPTGALAAMPKPQLHWAKQA